MSSSVRIFPVILLASCALCLGESAWAQPQGAGFEVALHGSSQAVVGQPLVLRGRAFEVLGLAELRPLSSARVRARYATAAADVPEQNWVEVRAGSHGRFQIRVPVPESGHGESSVELTVDAGDEDQRRIFEVPITLSSPFLLEIRTDRVLYEPGERVHLWALLRDTTTGRPVAGAPIRFSVSHEDSAEAAHRGETSAAGVASFSFQLPESAATGWRDVEVVVERGGMPVREEARFSVGRRAIERLSASVEVSPEVVRPSDEMTVTVEVRTPSGAPVRGARAELELEGGRSIEGTTDDRGIAEIRTRAPAFLADPAGRVSLRGRIRHPGYGSIEVRHSFDIALPLTLRVDAVPLHGGLVPEVEDQMLLTLLDVAGEPPAEGTEVEVRGVIVADRSGVFRGRTDRHGLVAVPTKLPRSAVAEHLEQGNGPCHGRRATTFEVVILGDAPRAARLCSIVASEALVAPTVARPVIHPGESVEVSVERRPEVARNPVAVDLIRPWSDRELVVASGIAAPGQDRISLDVPGDQVGVFWVRARPLDLDGVAQGAGALDGLIVTPRHPSFPTIEADREIYQVRGRARLTVRTDPESSPSYMAVLARDLAVHGGERPFDSAFLGEALDRALLDPSEEPSERLIRAALAAMLAPDPTPARAPRLSDELGRRVGETYHPNQATARGDLRDPLARGRELQLRGIGPIMGALEQALAQATVGGDLDRLVTGEGRARRFHPEAVSRARQWPRPPETLGGEPLTLEHLRRADPSFSFETAARRVARQRLVALLNLLVRATEGGRHRSNRRIERISRTLLQEPPDRWLGILVHERLLRSSDLLDPWGGSFVIHRSTRDPVLPIGVRTAGWELLSPGPDGIAGNGDDVRDPFERVVPRGTPYAVASGEDRLMDRLASLSHAEPTLTAMLRAYGQLGWAAAEEERGDVATASVSEDVTGMSDARFDGTIGLGNLQTIGHGGGGGSGAGYGRGAGGLGLRRAQVSRAVPRPRVVIQGGGRGILSDLMRERFPATLRFIPELAVDPSGETVIDLPLAHAATTYRVEVVVWSQDGWIWSASQDIRVDQELVVDAPIPPVAAVGDRIHLPLRVANRGDAPRRLHLRAETSAEIGAQEQRTAELEVPAGGTGTAVVVLRPSRSGEGVVTVSAWAGGDQPLDAMQRPLRVVEDRRRVRDRRDLLISGSGALELEIPAGASPWAEGQIRVSSGTALFAERGSETSLWPGWSVAMSGEQPSEPEIDAALAELPEPGEWADSLGAALALGTLWTSAAVEDDRLAGVVTALSDHLSEEEQTGPSGEGSAVLTWSLYLLALAPAISQADRRGTLGRDLLDLVRQIRELAGTMAVRASEAPWTWAGAAAALIWTAPPGSEDTRAAELLRRARRSLIEVGEDLWLEGGAGDQGDRLVEASAMMALAEVRGGERDRALRLVRTLARMAERSEARSTTELAGWGPAVAAARILAGGRSVGEVTVVVDGEESLVELDDGAGTLTSAALSRPGAHRIEFRAAEGAILFVEIRSEYGLPWEGDGVGSGPFEINLGRENTNLENTNLGGEHTNLGGAENTNLGGEIEPGALDEISTLDLDVRNRSPRRISRPIIEIYLPSGAEIEQSALEDLQRQTGHAPELDGRILRLELPPLAPGESFATELRIRWSVAGELRGLGMVGYAQDRPRAAAVVPTRVLRISESRVEPAGGSRGGQ